MSAFLWWLWCVLGWPHIRCRFSGEDANFRCMECGDPVSADFWCAGPSWIASFHNGDGRVGLCAWCHNHVFGWRPLR